MPTCGEKRPEGNTSRQQQPLSRGRGADFRELGNPHQKDASESSDHHTNFTSIKVKTTKAEEAALATNEDGGSDRRDTGLRRCVFIGGDPRSISETSINKGRICF